MQDCHLRKEPSAACGGSENQTTGLRPMEMHPYPRLRRYFPRRGKSALLSAFGLIQYEQHFGELAACGGFFPLWCLRHHLPPAKAVGQQPVLCLEQHLKLQSHGALFFPHLRGKSREAGKGALFPSPAGRLYGFLFSHGRSPVVKFYTNWRPFFFKGANHNPQRRRRCCPLSESEHNPLPKGQSPFSRAAAVHLTPSAAF